MSKAKQFVVDIHLVVKANSVSEVERLLQKELGGALAAWLARDKEAIPGEGFPAGSLLYYRYGEAKEVGANA